MATGHGQQGCLDKQRALHPGHITSCSCKMEGAARPALLTVKIAFLEVWIPSKSLKG